MMLVLVSSISVVVVNENGCLLPLMSVEWASSLDTSGVSGFASL